MGQEIGHILKKYMKKEKNIMEDTSTTFSRRRFLTRTAAGVVAVGGVGVTDLASRAFSSLSHAHAASALTNFPHGQFPVLGHDISTLQQLESVGKTFSDGGHTLPLERILAYHGATYIRERLWVNPPIPFNDLPHILTMARRIKAAGLRFLLDFHYSDFWADPGHQTTPQAWQGQDLPTLTNTLYNYTRDVLDRLAAQGTPPDMVQTGNEVTDGMLWPLGQIYVNGSQNWPQFTTLLKAAIAAVRHSGRGARVMVHIDRGGDNGGARYFYDHILQQGVDFDVIGLSYYPWWHGPLSALQANLNDLAPRYNKDIVVVETAYPWTLDDGDGYPNNVSSSSQLLPGYPASPSGQSGYMGQILSILSQVPDNRAKGVVYWEPAWIPGVGWEPGAGDAWDNMALFDFQGRALPSIAVYQGAGPRP